MPRSPARTSRRCPALQPGGQLCGERVSQATTAPPHPTGDAGDWLSPPWPRPATAPPCRPYLRAAVRAPEVQSRRGRRVILVLPDPGRCARVSRPAAPFQLPVFPGLSWSPPVGQGHRGNGGGEDRGAYTREPSSFRWENCGWLSEGPQPESTGAGVPGSTNSGPAPRPASQVKGLRPSHVLSFVLFCFKNGSICC